MSTRWPPTKQSELAVFIPTFSTAFTAQAVALGETAAEATAFATLSGVVSSQ